jgi:hypothetical protein
VTGALTWARLSYRQQKWELLLVVIGVVGLTAGMLWFASTLGALRDASPECLAGLSSGLASPMEEGPSAACQAFLNEYYGLESWASNLTNLAWVAPFGMGVILGAPLVAREIDGGTAQLAWSLSRSRVGWLLRRIAFVTLFGLILLAIIAVASELLTGAIFPDRTLDEDFAWFGRRGAPIVARGVGAILLGVLVGAVIGRVLPAVLVSILVIGLAFTGVSLALDQVNRSEATLQPMFAAPGEPQQFDVTGMQVAFGIERTDGDFMTYSEAFDRGLTPNFTDEKGQVFESEEALRSGDPIGRDAVLTIAGEKYPLLVLRDSAVAVFVGLVALALSAVVVVRRRPA